MTTMTKPHSVTEKDLYNIVVFKMSRRRDGSLQTVDEARDIFVDELNPTVVRLGDRA